MKGPTGDSGLLKVRQLAKHSCCSKQRLATASAGATTSPRQLYAHKSRAVLPLSTSLLCSRTLPSSSLVASSPRAAASMY